MENVPRIRASNTYKYIYERMKKVGYGLTEKVLDASYCGVPQKRKRMFLIGHLGAEDGFLEDILVAGLSKKPLSIYDYLGDSLGVEYYFRIPRSYNRRAIFSIYEPCVTIRGVDRPILQITNTRDLLILVPSKSINSKRAKLCKRFEESF